MVTLAQHRGLAIVVQRKAVVGIFTAGDLTRLVEREPRFLELTAGAVMIRTPRTATPETLAAVVTGEMERAGIMAMPVISADGVLQGVVHLHDLLRAGAV